MFDLWLSFPLSFRSLLKSKVFDVYFKELCCFCYEQTFPHSHSLHYVELCANLHRSRETLWSPATPQPLPPPYCRTPAGVDFTCPLELCCLKLCTKMLAVDLLCDARYVCCGLFQMTQQRTGCGCRMLQDLIFTQLYSILTLVALLYLSFIYQ